MMTIANRPSDRARWLALAASPTFALMAIASAIDAQPMAVCGSMPGIDPAGGMTTMYALMGLFHLPAWLKPARRG